MKTFEITMFFKDSKKTFRIQTEYLLNILERNKDGIEVKDYRNSTWFFPYSNLESMNVVELIEEETSK